MDTKVGNTLIWIAESSFRLNKLSSLKELKPKYSTNSESLQQGVQNLQLLAFQAQVNSHFIFNALSAIQFFITANDKKSALSYLSIFGKLIRHRLETFQKETVLLNDEIACMEWYLKLQHLRYGERFYYQINNHISENARNTQIPSSVIPILLEHTVNVAIVGKIKSKIIIEVSRSKYKIQLAVQSNLPDFWNINTKDINESETSWKSQIQKLNALKFYQIQEKSTPLADKAGQVIGAAIELHIPILA